MHKQLTRAEENVMQVLWTMGKGFLREILDTMPEPKPHQNTLATILKILTEKEFVRVEVIGRNHLYHPLISKETYSKTSVHQMVDGYFEGSFSNMVSFFLNEKELDLPELEKLLDEVKKAKQDL
jgi:BlaI family transcriptional regulator, penicillinase repressor